MFRSLKIAVCVPKITIGRKKLKIPIRLKITERSKNPYLKISVHQWASRPEWCTCSGHLQRIAGSTGRKAGERQRVSHKGRAGADAGTHTTGKERDTGKPIYRYLCGQ